MNANIDTTVLEAAKLLIVTMMDERKKLVEELETAKMELKKAQEQRDKYLDELYDDCR